MLMVRYCIATAHAIKCIAPIGIHYQMKTFETRFQINDQFLFLFFLSHSLDVDFNEWIQCICTESVCLYWICETESVCSL